MSAYRRRFSMLMQWMLVAMLSLSLLVPASVHAAEGKRAKTAQKSHASRSVDRKKREELQARKKSKPTRTSTAKRRTSDAKSAATRYAERKAPRAKNRKTVAAHRRGAASVTARNAQRGSVYRAAYRPSVVREAPPSVAPAMSYGEKMGLSAGVDPLDLNSRVALVVDQQTQEVLLSKNVSAVSPIASLTKLMTGLIVSDANLPLDELITITSDDVDTLKGSRSRLAVGTTLTRRELMHLALMSSENRAAHALGRTFPGGMSHFVQLMNAKARELGMYDTRYVEPTGLSSSNQSSARDLVTLVSAAYERPLLRSLSTSPSHQVDLGARKLEFRNSNRLVRDPEWDIGLQKTGYIVEAGRCLVMQAQVAGRQFIMVFLDATGKTGRAQDAERVRRWLEVQPSHASEGFQPQG